MGALFWFSGEIYQDILEPDKRPSEQILMVIKILDLGERWEILTGERYLFTFLDRNGEIYREPSETIEIEKDPYKGLYYERIEL